MIHSSENFVVIFIFLLRSLCATDYAGEFFKLAQVMGHFNSTFTTASISMQSPIARAHLIRVPKASSSSLSIIARRLTGCGPQGPCCKWPGDPPGSCPSKELYKCQEQGRVIGCTHHHPNYNFLKNMQVPSISIMREPKSRAISAFFYPGIHHNSKCTDSQHKCFLEYTSSMRWQNIVVKLLTGLYAYENKATCTEGAKCTHSLELAVNNLRHLTFMGIAEMWELSMLILHIKIPSFPPLLYEFQLSTPRNSTTTSPTGGIRTNKDSSYSAFKRTAMGKYGAELEKQNGLDGKLYAKVTELMCSDLHRYNLWSNPLVRTYWSEKSLHNTSTCPIFKVLE